MSLVLGVDGGGTKTLAAVATADGRIVGVGRTAGSNYQAFGLDVARANVAEATHEALAAAGARPADLARACYGLSGADRPKDYETVREMLEPVAPTASFDVVNDTTIALRAGTENGVGIALIAGTGSNAIGRNAAGSFARVGGLARILGDGGGAIDLGEGATARAMRGHDGRGTPTVLYERIVAALGLETLDDVIEHSFHSSLRPRDLPELSVLAPLVFEAAEEGDAVARDLVCEAGTEAGRSANVLLRRLFRPDEAVAIVLAGSLWQRARNEIMRRGLADELDAGYPHVAVSVLDVEPVLGALLFALDGARGTPVPAAVRDRLATSWAVAAGGPSPDPHDGARP